MIEQSKSICDTCKHKDVCKYVEEFEKLSLMLDQIRSDGMSDIFKLDVFCTQIDIQYQGK